MRTWLGLSHVLVQRGCEVPVEEEELLLEKAQPSNCLDC